MQTERKVLNMKNALFSGTVRRHIFALLIAVSGFLLLCRTEETEKKTALQEVLAPPEHYTLRNGAVEVRSELTWREPGARTPLIRTEMGKWQAEIAALPGGVLEFFVLSHFQKPVRLYLQGVRPGQDLQLRLLLQDGWIRFFWASDADPVNCPVRSFRLQKGECRFSHGLRNSVCFMQIIPLRNLYAGSFLLAAGIIFEILLCFLHFRSKTLHPRLRWAFAGTAAGFLLAGAIVLFHILCGKNFYPFNTFLFRPGTFADDLFQSFACVRYVFMPYAWNGAGNYLPFTYSLLRFFPSPRLDLLAALLYGAFAAALVLPALKIVRPGSWFEGAALLLIAWGNLPALLLWNSGNLEMLIYLLCIAFVLTYRRFPAAAAVVLAAAINIKLYPGVLGVLFLKRKDWKNAGICAAVSLLFFLGSMGAMEWDFQRLFRAFGSFSDLYLCYINDGLIFSHSLMSLFRYIGHHFFGLGAKGVLSFVPCYYALCLALFAGVLFLLFRRKYAFWEELYLLLGCAVLLPPVSFDYTLVLLLIPYWFFLRESSFQLRDKIALFLWVLIFIPENYYASPLWQELQISVLIKPLALTAMSILIFSGKEEKPGAAKITGSRI